MAVGEPGIFTIFCPDSFCLEFFIYERKGFGREGESDGNAGKREKKKISAQNLQWKITRDFFFFFYLPLLNLPVGGGYHGLTPYTWCTGDLPVGQCTSGDAMCSHPFFPMELGLPAAAAASANPDSRGVMLPRLLNWQHVRGMSPG